MESSKLMGFTRRDLANLRDLDTVLTRTSWVNAALAYRQVKRVSINPILTATPLASMTSMSTRCVFQWKPCLWGLRWGFTFFLLTLLASKVSIAFKIMPISCW